MSRSAHFAPLFAALFALSACAGSPMEACETMESSTSFGITVNALMTHVTMDDEGSMMTDAEYADCVDFTVTTPSRDWELNGVTPSAFDVAPGDYIVELSWQDNGVDYLSDPVLIEHGLEPETVTLALCPDMTGDWRCVDGDEEWAMALESVGCGVEMWPMDEPAEVRGHFIESEHFQGQIGPNARELMLLDRAAPEAMISCSREQ